MVILFIISGKAESGKDTVANFIMKNSNCHNNYNLHIANQVKNIARNDFGWDMKKDVKGRELLQLIGDGGRQYNPDIWINKFLQTLDDIVNPLDKDMNTIIVVPDVRYKNEVIKLVEWGHKNDVATISIRVDRPNHVNSLTEEQRQNGSETDLDDWGIWDVNIINDSTPQDLEATVLNTLEVFGIDY